MRYSFEILLGAVIFEILMRRTLSCLASVGLVIGKVYFFGDLRRRVGGTLDCQRLEEERRYAGFLVCVNRQVVRR